MLFDDIGDQRGIAVNVGADLQHRRLAVATGERSQIRLWHDVGNMHRGPGLVLEAEDQSDLLSERRRRIVMQDELLHGLFSVKSNQLFAEVVTLEHADE